MLMEKEYTKALDRAMKLLSSKARTVEELRELLTERYLFGKSVCGRVIDRLKELRYLNDEQLAADVAASRLRSRPIGRRRLKQELRQKRLADSIVESTLRQAYEARDEKEILDEAIRRRIRSRGRPKNRKELKSLYDHLLRQGFGYDEIRAKLARLPDLSGDDLD